MTPPFAKFDSTLKGKWVNAGLTIGFNLSNERPMDCLFWQRKTLYTYTPIYESPTYYEQVDGTCIAAGQFDPTDQGSVPVVIQKWIPKDGSHGFYTHDFIYKTGGAFFRYPGEKVWTFRQVTRAQADMLLRVSAQYDKKLPITAARAWWVWIGVCSARPFTPSLFHEWKPVDGIPKWPVEDVLDGTDPAGGYGGG